MTPWVQRLLIANVVMYFLQQTVPGFTEALLFVPALVLVRPWTIVTYMFLHGSPMHIIMNMLGLYFFGPRVESRLGSSHFVRLYFLSGLTGAGLSFLFSRTPILGASGAIFGVLLAFAYFWPRDQIMIWGILPVEARWMVIGYTVFSLYSGLNGSRSGVADFAHLGGFVGAFLYLKWIGSQRELKKFQKKAMGGVAETTLKNWRKVDPTSVHALNRDEVNRILDKISADGMGSLTQQERLFLSNFVPLDDRPPPVS